MFLVREFINNRFGLVFFGVSGFQFSLSFFSEIEFLANDPEFSPTENTIINFLTLGVCMPFILPAYIGLLLYALPSNKLWEKIER